MLRIGDPVWHKQYGSGHLARTSGADHWVMFDNPVYNVLVSTEPPPTETTPSGKTITVGPAPLDGKVIYWDKPASDMPRPKVEKKQLTKEQERFKYPSRPGYFTVLKVGQAFGMHYDEVKKEWVFSPVKNRVDVRLEDTETGEKFKVRISNVTDPSLYTARKMTSDSITGLIRGEDALW